MSLLFVFVCLVLISGQLEVLLPQCTFADASSRFGFSGCIDHFVPVVHFSLLHFYESFCHFYDFSNI